MKMNYGKKRQAISPVIATVILIAITLIAAIAIAGFVFGLFGSFSSSAQVTVTGLSIPAGASQVALSSASCATTAAVPYVAISNSGTSATTATGFSITYGGNTYSQLVAAGCTVSAAGASGSTEYVNINLAPGPTFKGVQFVGAITLGNGATVSFTGTFT